MTPLIKAFECMNHATNFMAGNIILKSLEYYISQKPPYGDRNEGTIIHKDGATTLCDDMFILCMHDARVMRSSYGKHKVEIIDPDNLYTQIKSRIKTSLMRSDSFDKVTYYNSDDPLPTDDISKIPFYKTENFQEDLEHRMLFTFQDNNFCNSDNIEFKFYKINYFSPRNDILLASFEDWKQSKNNSTHYGDDHYIEMHLSGIIFESKFTP